MLQAKSHATAGRGRLEKIPFRVAAAPPASLQFPAKMDANTSTALGEFAGAPRAEDGDAANQESEENKSERKKRDRWTAAPTPSADDVENAKGTEGDSSKKKSRWGTKQEELPPSNSAMVPFGMPGSLVRFGNPSGVGAFNAQVGAVNPDQVKIQIRIAEIQSLYGRPRCTCIPPGEMDS
jgi:hypothetical protein